MVRPDDTRAAEDRRQRLLELYHRAPFHRHPLWRGVLEHTLSLAQIIAAERQHYVRTRAGRAIRRAALDQSRGGSERILEALLRIYLEECAGTAGPSHLDLIKRLCVAGGVLPEELDQTPPTPGNAAAIALYRDIAARGAACHLIGAGAVEFYYSDLAPKVYDAYTRAYGMTSDQAETYRIHGPMDREHAEGSLGVLDDAIAVAGWPLVELSVRDAFVATNLHYDGMLQAATGKLAYWDGEDR